ncbi:unnamed protein product [Symbiodinium natans]|uniref:MAM domain-containing protein n=1 Tax=Symbiodinium natans TaxID=878477 RepID=A0A812K3E8_9DINO|nr:unnamed protein product [Symbiodinium natans]
MQTEDFMLLIRKGLADAAPVLFPPSPECLTEMRRAFPEKYQKLSLWATSGTVQTLVHSLENRVPLTEANVPALAFNMGFDWFSCICKPDCSASEIATPIVAANFGWNGQTLRAPNSVSDNDREALHQALIEHFANRKAAMGAWECQAMDVVAKSAAVSAYKSCLQQSAPIAIVLDGTDLPAAPNLNCSFESNFCGWDPDVATSWPADPNADWAWKRKSGPTSSAYTGPSAAHSGEWYVYVEASIQPGGFEKTAVLQSISLEGYRIFRLNFWYHMYGTAIASLRVQILVAGSWTTLWEKSGDQGNSWLQASVQIPAIAERVRFYATTGVGVKGDIGLDDIVATTAGVTIELAATAGTCLRDSEPACPKTSCGPWLLQC